MAQGEWLGATLTRLQNTPSAITGYERDRAADSSAATFLSKGLEGYLKESTADRITATE